MTRTSLYGWSFWSCVDAEKPSFSDSGEDLGSDSYNLTCPSPGQSPVVCVPSLG